MLESTGLGLQHSLGPATVLEVTKSRLRLETPMRIAWAQLALAYPYSPQRGDVVLAIGDDDLYVIGVLSSKGQTRLDFSGDVRLRASGVLQIEAGQRLALAAPTVSLRAGSLEVLAHKIVERFFDSMRCVRNTLRVVAGRQRIKVEEDSSLRAGSISEIARGDVRLDGKQIKLG
jgi:hypothetical protein